MSDSSRINWTDGTRWWLLLLVGLGVALSTYLLQQLVIYVYVFGPRFVESSVLGHLLPAWGIWEVERAEGFGNLVGLYVMPALHLALVTVAATWVGRRSGTDAALRGISIGLAATAANQAIGLLYGPLVPRELVVYTLLGVVGGILGGLRGWNIRSGERALHEVSQALGEARDAEEIAAAVGKRLAGSNVGGVILWRAAGGELREFELAGWWKPGKSGSKTPEIRPDALWVSEGESVPRKLGLAELTEEERAACRHQGVRSALLVPLDSPHGKRVGLLVVTSRRIGGFSALDRRAYATAAAGVGLALENLRLAEEARQAATVRERQRMAHEIHDTLAQGFTSIVMNAQAAGGALSRNPASLHEHLSQIERTARESLAEARRLVWALRPERLAQSSPGEALGELAGSWSRESGVEAAVEVSGKEQPLSEEAEATLLRTSQEALSNVRKHAEAGRVALTLSYMGERVMLDVRDDGAGFDPGATDRISGKASESSETNGHSGGFGLAGMHERAESVGGMLTVESAPGEGTTIALELPLNASSDSPDTQQQYSEIAGKLGKAR